MGLLLSTRRALAMGGGYADKVLGYDPIAYWPLDEGGGTTARCLVNTAQNGTATGVTWANDSTGPFGTPAPYFDGANDYVDIDTAAFVAAFNGSEGSAVTWFRQGAAGVWTDGASRYFLHINVDADNYLRLLKAAANNTIEYIYKAGGTTEYNAAAALTGTGWYCMAITWSASAGVNGEVRYYLNGASAGATDTALGVWAGSVDTAAIGAFNIVPANVHQGWEGHCAMWDRALSAGEITDLANP